MFPFPSTIQHFKRNPFKNDVSTSHKLKILTFFPFKILESLRIIIVSRFILGKKTRIARLISICVNLTEKEKSAIRNSSIRHSLNSYILLI